MFAGTPSVGKTSLLLQAFEAHETGKDHVFKFHGSILYIATDRNMEYTERRARSLGISGVSMYCPIDDGSLTVDAYELLMEKPTDFRKEIWRRTGADKFDTVVLDPVGAFLSGNVNDYRLRASCSVLGKIASEGNQSIIGLHHACKARNDPVYKNVIDNTLGSVALQGFVGINAVLQESDDHHILAVRPTDGPEEEWHLRRRQDGFFDWVVDTEDSLALQLPGDEFSVDHVMLNFDYSRATAYRKLGKLEADGKIQRVRRGIYRKSQVQ